MTEFQFEFLYDSYKAEVEFKHNIDTQAPFYALLISAFGGAESYLFTHVAEVPNGDWRMLIVSLTILSTIALAFAIYHFALNYVWQRYRFIPNPVELENYFRQILLHFQNDTKRTDDECPSDLAAQLARIALFNRQVNRKRYVRYTNCATFLIVSLVFWSAAGVIFMLTR